jgi:hypothetical protein
MKNSVKKITKKSHFGGWGACLLIAHALNSCSLFPEPEPTLPPATQTGANTFGCLINGKVFQARGGGGMTLLQKIMMED